MRITLCLALLFATVRAVPHAAQAGPLTQVRSHGLELTLRLAYGSYPRNALIWAHVKVRNVSHHTIWMPGTLSGVDVSDFDASGPLYSPYDPLGSLALFEFSGPPRHLLPLRPGTSWNVKQLVILYGDRVEAEAAIGTQQVVTSWIHTRPLVVTLTDAPGPTISLSTSPWQASISAPWKTSRPLWYISEEGCKYDGGISSTSSTGGGWSTAYSTIIAPHFPDDCSDQQIWHVIAGRVNHPVTVLAYPPNTG